MPICNRHKPEKSGIAQNNPEPAHCRIGNCRYAHFPLFGIIASCATTRNQGNMAHKAYSIEMVTPHIGVLHATMQLNSRMDYIDKSSAMQGAASFTLFCLVFVLSSSLILAFVAMIAITILVGLAYELPRAIQFEPTRLGISRAKVKHLALYCLPLAHAQCFSISDIQQGLQSPNYCRLTHFVQYITTLGVPYKLTGYSCVSNSSQNAPWRRLQQSSAKTFRAGWRA